MANRPVLGVEYLIDWYGALGVPRDADVATISEIGKQRIAHYRPERFAEGNVPLQMAAADRLALMQQAVEVLTDDAQRRAFDEQLDGWHGNITKYGASRVHWNDDLLFDGNAVTSQKPDMMVAKAESLARQASRFCDTVFAFVQTCAHRDTDDQEARAAYREVLRQQDAYLECKEALLWKFSGAVGHAPHPMISPEYRETAERDLAEFRRVADQEIGEAMLCIFDGEICYQGKGAKAFASGELEGPEDFFCLVTLDLDRYAVAIRAIAKARQENARNRIMAAHCEYVPEQIGRHDRLIVNFRSGTASAWTAFRRHENEVREDETVDRAALARCEDPDVASEWIGDGCNVMVLECEPGIDGTAQVLFWVQQHYDAFDQQK